MSAGTPALRTRSRRLLVRQALLQRLSPVPGRRCIVLRAPAGFGKSSLLLTWQRELVAEGIDIAWVRLAELAELTVNGEGDLHFMTALMGALAAVDAAIARHAVAHAQPDADAIERLVIALVRGIAAHGRQIVLVVDDVHSAQSENVHIALQLLVAYAPPNLLCVLASRNSLPMTLAPAPGAGTVLTLESDDLRFSLQESVDYLRMRLPDLDERSAAALHRLADGWPALLRLASADLRRRRGARPLPPEGVPDLAPFAAYFGAHVFPRLSVTQLRLLTLCAAPTRFSAALCAELAGTGYSAAQCAELLVPAAREGLLRGVTPGATGAPGAMDATGDPAEPGSPVGAPQAPADERWWQLHPLLRRVLLARLASWPEAERQKLHAKAWPSLALRGMHHQAVRHALAAHDHAAAARLAERGAVALFVQGKLIEAIALVRQLDPATLGDNPNLRLWAAWVELADYRLDDCARSIAALRAEPGGIEPAMRYRLTLLECLLAIRRDDSDALQQLLSQLLAPPAAADDFARAGRRNVLTWLHLRNGEFERARQIQRDEPLAMIGAEPVVETLFGSLVGQCLVGLSYAAEGQVHGAERIYRNVLREMHERGTRCTEVRRLTAQLLAEVLYERHGPLVAARSIEEQPGTQSGLIPDTTLRMILVANRALQAAGRWREALEHLAQAAAFLQRQGIDRGLACVLLEQLQVQLTRNDADAARATLQDLEALHALHPDVESGALRQVADSMAQARIRLAMHDNQPAQLPLLLSHIEALALRYRQRGQVGLGVALQLQAAEIERRLGRTEASGARVRAALRLGHRLGLMQTLLGAHDNALALIQAARAVPNLDPVLVFFAERIEALARPPQPRDEHAGQRASAISRDDRGLVRLLTLREAEVVELLVQAMPNKKIALTLGLSLDTVKWHLKNIYLKLDAHGRDAVAKRLRMEREGK
ncbi:LuxR C-terminal-related transcriptional regulator [Variovorax sp. J22G73]|uniref:LuxR C-terminal-related transcriptional regulator n=1 Tax=unclassified Variovorax TaxID=663243 RepID=UPI000D5DBC73|nr:MULTISPECIES: LuxR C-terminal-related transcriptional regulator [unclassified Variovorax]MDM0003340.1 LuxR C-terminal-related transcriptional regulator [Variovorax sp. J22R203]MDM0096994.1 LuxR C-terminal-related transcriptional regulator [Variovorax sp. J22G73]